MFVAHKYFYYLSKSKSLMKKLIFIALCLFVKPSFSVAQSCLAGASRQDMRGVNAMRAAFLNCGDIFWDLNDSQFGLEARGNEPFRGTIFTGGLWLGGKDALGNLCMAASTFRTATLFDYTPGPLTNALTTTATCAKWDKHWAVTRADIDKHVSQLNRLGRITDTVASIFSWPGRNNPFFSRLNTFELPVNQSFAPFFDKNGDGNYTPQLGDYPLPENVKPEAAPTHINYCVFNDNGSVHTVASRGLPVKAEIHQTAFAYGGFGTYVDSCVFTSHKIIYKGLTALDSFSIGLFIDFDLGCFVDDFAGSIPASNAFYAYNRDSIDDVTCLALGGTTGFGTNPPVQAVSFLNKTLSKLMVINNISTASPPVATTTPATAIEFSNILNGKWRDGTPLTSSGTGYNPGATNTTNFAFSGDPNDAIQWSMYQNNRRSTLPTYDIQSVGSTFIGRLNPSDTVRLDAAYSLHRNANGDNIKNIGVMQGGLPKILNLYETKFQSLARGVATEEKEILSDIKIYPNPTNNEFWIESDSEGIDEVSIFNTIGQVVRVEKPNKSYKLSINAEGLNSGIYFIKIKAAGKTASRRIVVQH
jgi:Secretion system C-terminal sorting domain